MAATTTLLGLVTPTQGTLSGTWGDTVNYGISDYVDISVAGTLTLTNDGAVTLANTTGSSSGNSITSSLTGAGTVTAQFAIVRVTGTLTVAKVVTGPSYSKTYTVVNAATGGIVTFKASGQTGVSVAVGESAFVYFNGTDYVKIVGTATAGAAGGSTTQVQYNNAGVLAGITGATTNGTALTLVAPNLGSPASVGTMPAFTLGGTVSGGGNQINNVIIGTTTPLAGTFTQVDITAQGPLRLQDTTGGEYVGLRSPSALGASYTLTFPADDGTSGQALITDGSGVLSWSTAASGDVYGPGSSTDNAVARFDSTTGKLLQNSVVIIDDAGAVTGVTNLSASSTVGVGDFAAASAVGLNVRFIGNLTSTDIQGVGSSISAPATASVSTINFYSSLRTTATSGSRGLLYNFYAEAPSMGATSTASTMYGLYVANQGNAAITNAYGVRIEAQSGSTTTNVGLYNGGTSTLVGGATIEGLTVGRGAGAVSTNTAVGASALAANTTGAYNTVVGATALDVNTTGNYNQAFGYAALGANTTGELNSVFGMNAMVTNTTGSNNVAVGHDSLGSNTTASNNTAVGHQSLYSNTTASNNTAVGYQAAYANTTGASLVAIGYQSLYTNTTGESNIAIGQSALRLNTTGVENVSVGRGALYANSTGNYNIAIGHNTLFQNTTASNNTAVGYQAGYSGTTANTNVIVGYRAAYSNLVGNGLTAVGYLAGFSCTDDTNTFLGYNAGYSKTSGGANIYIGNYAGSTSTTGSNNVLIGNSVRASAITNGEELVIASGYNATGKGSSTGFISVNGGGVYQGNNSTLWSVTSDQRIKKNIVNNNTGLDIINQIQVRNFEYRLPEEITDVPQNQAVKKQGVQLGVIAQELQQILPECVKTESTGVMTVDADNLTWYLVNAVKELSAQVAQLQSQLNQGA